MCGTYHCVKQVGQSARQTMSWPIIGVFFWWLAGYSVEALLFSRYKILKPKVRAWQVVASLPAMGLGAALAGLMLFDQSARKEFDYWMTIAAFGGMWVALGATTLWRILFSGDCEGDSPLAKLRTRPECLRSPPKTECSVRGQTLSLSTEAFQESCDHPRTEQKSQS